MKLYKKHISDLGKVITGKTPRTSILENYGGKIPFLTPSDNLSEKFSPTTSKTLTKIGLNEVKNCLLPSKSICVSCIGSDLGKVVLTKKPTVTNQQFNSIVPNEENDADFIYYLMTVVGKHLNYLSKTSTAVPIINKSTFANYEIEIPNIKEQKRIGKILSSLDDKIELNRRINDNLEQQAQALFKSWFVDFEPFLSKEFSKSDSLFGDIPVGWSIVSIKDLPIYITDYVANGSFASLKENVRLYDKPNYAHFIRNTDLKAESYKIYVDKHSYEFLSKSVLEGGEIIISNVGDVGSVFLCPKLQKPMTLGNNIILLRPKNKYSMFYLYMLFKGNVGQHLIDGITGGSAQRKFNKTDFKSIKIMMPPVDILIKFDRIIKPIFSKIEKNSEEISRLELVRDTLLPKLMSGEVEINKINN